MAIYRLSSSRPILCFKITGRLTSAELNQLQATARTSIENWGKISILVILEKFEGWEKGSGWGNTSFSDEHDKNIGKMAIVGPERWRDWVYAFVGKGFRSVTTEFFLPSQLDRARNWVSSDTANR